MRGVFNFWRRSETRDRATLRTPLRAINFTPRGGKTLRALSGQESIFGCCGERPTPPIGSGMLTQDGATKNPPVNYTKRVNYGQNVNFRNGQTVRGYST